MGTSEKLWGGRFCQPTDPMMEQFSQSVSYDRRLYRHDIAGSIAHAKMLAAQDIITPAERDAIVTGLQTIARDIEQGQFAWSIAREDVHMNIEGALIDRIGDAGKKLHTARSRNDQIATDMRLYLRAAIDDIGCGLTELQAVLVNLAAREVNTVMPGYTHLQIAQPVSFGHHVLAWYEMLARDYARLQDCRTRVNICPLGSAALAGSGYPLDREWVGQELGFAAISANSLDAVADRDFVIEFNAHAALLMVHLSRIAEELIIWSSDGFSFVDLGDDFCTGSSIMPQKKNPDAAELTRGKAARVSGNLMAVLMLMKAQPLAYNRDNQEDKEPLFDSVDTVQTCLAVFSAMLAGMTVHRANMLAAAQRGYATATDLADYLVAKKVPFREAHAIVGKIVNYALEHHLALAQMDLAVLQQFSDAIANDVYPLLEVQGSIASRDLPGGTAFGRVQQAVTQARADLGARTTWPSHSSGHLKNDQPMKNDDK